MLSDENQKLHNNIKNTKTIAPTSNDIEFRRKIADLENKLEQAIKNNKSIDLQNENKNIKNELNELALNNAKLIQQVEDQAAIISKFQENQALSVSIDSRKDRDKFKKEIDELKVQVNKQKAMTQETIENLKDENEGLKRQKDKMKDEWAEIYSSLKTEIANIKNENKMLDEENWKLLKLIDGKSQSKRTGSGNILLV